jgi:hypothetical protein
MPTCYNCNTAFEMEGSYPCGPCDWSCPNCGTNVSPCCGAPIVDTSHERGECDTCDYCGVAACSKCGDHCHCGGCI